MWPLGWSGDDRLLGEGAAVGDRWDADLALEVVAQDGRRREAALARDALDVEVGGLEQVARTEPARGQAQATRAARNLEAAEEGRPRLVAEQTTWQPATNLKDRLG